MRAKTTNHKILSLVTVLILVVGIAAGFWGFQYRPTPTAAPTRQHQPQYPQPKPVTELSYEGKDGQSVLALLKIQAQTITKDSSYGPYVESINGVKAGTDNKYWLFYVNGQQATVGADAYITKNGDKIEWKLQ